MWYLYVQLMVFLKPTNITLGLGKIRETIKMLLGAPLVASTQQQIGFFLSNGIMIPTVCLGEKHINHHNDYKSIYI